MHLSTPSRRAGSTTSPPTVRAAGRCSPAAVLNWCDERWRRPPSPRRRLGRGHPPGCARWPVGGHTHQPSQSAAGLREVLRVPSAAGVPGGQDETLLVVEVDCSRRYHRRLRLPPGVLFPHAPGQQLFELLRRDLKVAGKLHTGVRVRAPCAGAVLPALHRGGVDPQTFSERLLREPERPAPGSEAISFTCHAHPPRIPLRPRIFFGYLSINSVLIHPKKPARSFSLPGVQTRPPRPPRTPGRCGPGSRSRTCRSRRSSTAWRGPPPR